MSDHAAELQAALSLHRAGQLDAAAERYGTVLAAAPDQPLALHLLGLLRLARGQAREAIALLERATALRPPDARLRRALADACAASGDLPRAAREYAESLALQCDPQVLAAYALLLLRQGQPALALATARDAVALGPGLGEAHVALGVALRAAGRPGEAIGVLSAHVAAEPGSARGWLALGNAQSDLDDPEAAEACLRAAIHAEPALMEAHASLSTLLAETGRLDAAIASANTAVRLQPDSPAARWARAWALLLAGDFRAGFADFEWRKQHESFTTDFPPLPGVPWQGEPLAGRSLLVRAEQGLGDAIQFARFLPALARQGEVILACAPALVPLFAKLPVQVVAKSAAPACDLWVDQMSLPHILGLSADTIPLAEGYLPGAATPALCDGLRVGLAWAGNPRHGNDRRRSLPPALLAPLTRLPGVVAVSLQAGGGAVVGLADFHPADFAETADLIATLDLVVSVDTAVAHLAGAMGRPVLLMLPHAPDWRWMTGREDTPWYAKTRLFRQSQPGDWAGVVAAVTAAVAAYPIRYPAQVPTAAASPVRVAPHSMSATVTATDQFFRVARLVRS
jgi:tetratricopeptide (TPR) repeat protein